MIRVYFSQKHTVKGVKVGPSYLYYYDTNSRKLVYIGSFWLADEKRALVTAYWNMPNTEEHYNYINGMVEFNTFSKKLK